MVEFDLARATGDHRARIEAVISGLVRKYPAVSLRSVRTYDPVAGDRSMGNADEPGVIRLNARWFARSIGDLEKAAQRTAMPLGDGRTVAWHGPMTVEPDHVLTHEFGHRLADRVPAWREWQHAGWLASTADPDLAPSGYALTDEDEWGAEFFALVELGFGNPDQVREMQALLG